MKVKIISERQRTYFNHSEKNRLFCVFFQLCEARRSTGSSVSEEKEITTEKAGNEEWIYEILSAYCRWYGNVLNHFPFSDVLKLNNAISHFGTSCVDSNWVVCKKNEVWFWKSANVQTSDYKCMSDTHMYRCVVCSTLYL